jgi:hypothetical protein
LQLLGIEWAGIHVDALVLCAAEGANLALIDQLGILMGPL